MYTHMPQKVIYMFLLYFLVLPNLWLTLNVLIRQWEDTRCKPVLGLQMRPTTSRGIIISLIVIGIKTKPFFHPSVVWIFMKCLSTEDAASEQEGKSLLWEVLHRGEQK